MNILTRKWLVACCAIGLMGTGMTGCGQPAENVESPAGTNNPAAAAESGHNYKGRDWCAGHGVPESVCALCNAEVAAAFKKKGDWCAEHDRPDSQCFICHPEHKEKFAAAYKLKFGEDPPPMEDHDGNHPHEEKANPGSKG